jgi:putative transport protein
MESFTSLSTAHSLVLLMSVSAAGLAVGTIRLFGVQFGAAGVLFVGLLAGALGLRVDHTLLDFLREMGLMLFVFMMGLQLGPGFLASLRKAGLPLNSLALGIVASGFFATWVCGVLLGMEPAALSGLFAGSTTNTPSLGAAQQALVTTQAPAPQLGLPALAYAVSYPIGILGIIASMLILRRMFRVGVEEEVRAFEASQRMGIQPLQRLNVVVDNAHLAGLTLGELPGRRETGVVISRYQRADDPRVMAAMDDTRVEMGDHLLLVGTAAGLERFQRIVGSPSDRDLMLQPGSVSFRRVVVTSRKVLGKSIAQTGIAAQYAVAVTRIVRAGVEMTTVPELRLQFGDLLHLVGDNSSLDSAASLLGDSLKALNQTQFIPIFAGLAFGVLAGLVPLAIPGLSSPLKLGLAGGPLVVAILLGRLGRIGPLVWHMPANTNHAFRELGMVLFLSCVGLAAGPKFASTVMSVNGMLWALSAVGITMVPLLLAGVIARRWMKLNFVDICGLTAGSMTDPPALAFANTLVGSDAPSVAYATVYPATMLARIIAAQVLVIIYFG